MACSNMARMAYSNMQQNEERDRQGVVGARAGERLPLALHLAGSQKAYGTCSIARRRRCLGRERRWKHTTQRLCHSRERRWKHTRHRLCHSRERRWKHTTQRLWLSRERRWKHTTQRLCLSRKGGGNTQGTGCVVAAKAVEHIRQRLCLYVVEHEDRM